MFSVICWCHVKVTNGDTYLGGQEFDITLLEYLVSEFKRTTIGLSSSAKVASSSSEDKNWTIIKTNINLSIIIADASFS
jgi:molecular chaperone DnaK (HSP70)